MAFSTGLRMKGMILSIHHKLVDGVNNLWWISKLPVIDMSSDSEWDNAGIIGCIASDWKKVWVPWNHREESKLEVMPAMYYEAVMKSHAQIKLRKWQDWWMAGGRNQFLELPPTAPPPPPNGEPGVATVGKGSSPAVGHVPPTRLNPMQPQPPKYPPPPRAVDTNFFVLKTHIAAGNTLPAVKEEEEGSAASSSATAKAPAVPMQPPTSSVPKGPISQFLRFLDWGSPESHLHHHWFPNQILMWSLLLAGNQRW